MTEDEVVARLRSGHDHRHRRLGLAAQADVAGARDPALGPARPHHRLLRRPGRRAALRGGQGQRLVYGFVSLDSIPLEPHFRAARQSGAVDVTEYDEGMLLLGLYAAALRLPFLPTRAGLGSDVMRLNPELRTVTLALRRRRGAARGARRCSSTPRSFT